MAPFVFALVDLLACSHPTPVLHVQTGGEPTPAFADAPQGAMAPNPFTVDELRNSLSVGSTFRFEMRTPGPASAFERWRIVAATAETVTINTAAINADGSLLTDEGDETYTWDDLHHHADFPASDTVREDGMVEVPAGTFAVWHYVVRDAAADKISRFDFAKEYPGPPVKLTIQQGKGTVYEMILVERARP